MTKKATALPKSPETLEEAAEYGRQIAGLLNQVEKLENSFNTKIANLTNETEEKILPLVQEALGLSKSIFEFVSKNRKTLTQDETKKTVMLTSGALQWYATPPALKLGKEVKAEEIIAKLKLLKLERFIRPKEELNKEALVAEADVANTIEGVSVKGGEKFAIRPLGTDYRIEYTFGNKQWKVVSPKQEKQ